MPLLIGIALGDLLAGLPIDKSQNYTGTFWDLFQPYGVYTGITLVAICVLHGATFITLKTTGEVADRAARVAARSGLAVALIVIGWAVWTHVTAGKGFWPNPVEIGIVLVVIAAAWLASRPARRRGVHLQHHHDRAGHADAVHRPLPQRHDLQHQLRRTTSPSPTPRRRPTRSS